MCLIAIAPKGTDKTSEFFFNGVRSSAKTNRDGFGFAFKKADTGLVKFAKGFDNIEVMIKIILDLKLKMDDELVIHLRMRSAGEVCPENTHPFEIIYTSQPRSNNFNLKATPHPVLFHNGTFANFSRPGSKMSDTFNFTQDFMSVPGIWNMLKDNRKKFLEVFQTVLGSNKLAILSKETELIVIGEFITKGGFIFSNSSFERYEDRFHTRQSQQYPSQQQIGFQNSRVGNTLPSSDAVRSLELNTNSLKINAFNHRDFVLRAICNVSKNCTIYKDERFDVKSISKDGQLMIARPLTPANYIYIDEETLNACFIKLPKAMCQQKYIDYLKLKKTIDPVTNSSTKKIFSKICSYSNRKNLKLDTESIVTIKYKNQYLKLNYQAVLLYLMDYVKNDTDLRLIHEYYESSKFPPIYVN